MKVAEIGTLEEHLSSGNQFESSHVYWIKCLLAHPPAPLATLAYVSISNERQLLQQTPPCFLIAPEAPLQIFENAAKI